jgi:hypothetical protein
MDRSHRADIHAGRLRHSRHFAFSRRECYFNGLFSIVFALLQACGVGKADEPPGFLSAVSAASAVGVISSQALMAFGDHGKPEGLRYT